MGRWLATSFAERLLVLRRDSRGSAERRLPSLGDRALPRGCYPSQGYPSLGPIPPPRRGVTLRFAERLLPVVSYQGYPSLGLLSIR